MSVSVTLPALGESVTEGTVTRWLKQEGDTVAADEPLLEVSTDKVDTEIPAPAAGVLTSIKVREDETVAVGTELAVIDSHSAESAPSAPDTAAQPAQATAQPAQATAQPAPAAAQPAPVAEQAAPAQTAAPPAAQPAAQTAAQTAAAPARAEEPTTEELAAAPPATTMPAAPAGQAPAPAQASVEQAPAPPAAAQPALQVAKVLAHFRTNVSVGRHCRGALVLAILAGELVGSADE